MNKTLDTLDRHGVSLRDRIIAKAFGVPPRMVGLGDWADFTPARSRMHVAYRLKTKRRKR